MWRVKGCTVQIKDYRLPNMGGFTIANRLTAKLMVELREGDFATVQRLPSEVELAERYGVSRSVIRDVLANLEREGYVERGRGVGTMVNRQIVALHSRLDLKFEYNDLVRAAGATPGTDQVILYEKQADDDIAEKLEVDVGSSLLVCEKRVLASGVPVIYSIDHLPKALFSRKKWREYDWSSPVFELLETHCGIAVDTNITRLTAVCGPATLREKLAMKADEAMIFLEEVGYYKLSKPILHSYGYFTNFFEFTMLRKKF